MSAVYDLAKAKQILSICNVAEKQELSAEVTNDHYVGSEAYWRHEQDILADMVRIMRDRHQPEAGYPELVDLSLEHEVLYCPNVFITIAPGEEKVTKYRSFFNAYSEAAVVG